MGPEGRVNHAPDRRALAALPQEEILALDPITRKLELPAPDGQQNQTESKPAIEAEMAHAGLAYSGDQGKIEP